MGKKTKSRAPRKPKVRAKRKPAAQAKRKATAATGEKWERPLTALPLTSTEREIDSLLALNRRVDPSTG